MLSSELDTYGSVQLAGALIATLPVAVLFLIAQRSIVHAVASGAPTAS
jgi:ABC-type glycerol-3-phosphate transport system permease component